MKNKQIIAVGIMLMLPLALQAQENIKKAFDALINDNRADVSTTHKLNRIRRRALRRDSWMYMSLPSL